MSIQLKNLAALEESEKSPLLLLCLFLLIFSIVHCTENIGWACVELSWFSHSFAIAHFHSIQSVVAKENYYIVFKSEEVYNVISKVLLQICYTTSRRDSCRVSVAVRSLTLRHSLAPLKIANVVRFPSSSEKKRKTNSHSSLAILSTNSSRGNMLFMSGAFASSLPNAHFVVSASRDLARLLETTSDDGQQQLVIFAPTRSDTCFKTFSQHSDHNSRAIRNDLFIRRDSLLALLTLWN